MGTPSDPLRHRYATATRLAAAAAISVLATIAAGCGGGGGGDDPSTGFSSLVSAESQAASDTARSGADLSGASGAALDAFEQQVLEAVNAARANARSCGETAYAAAAPVGWSDTLEQAARGHSEYQQANNVVSHSGANGSSPGERVSAAGYDWSHVGENIAAGFPDIDAAIAAWLDSPGHCANLMAPVYAEIGLAVQQGSSGNQFSSYWTMLLAAAR